MSIHIIDNQLQLPSIDQSASGSAVLVTPQLVGKGSNDPSSTWEQMVASSLAIMAAHEPHMRHIGVFRGQWVRLGSVAPDSNEYHPLFDCGGHSLRYDIDTRKKPYTEAQIRQIITHVVNAVSLVHRYGYAHMDLHPGNIVLQWNGDDVHATVIDFGSAVPLRTSLLPIPGVRHVRSTARYIPPWYTTNVSHWTPETKPRDDVICKIDAWAICSILHEMITCHYPSATLSSSLSAPLTPSISPSSLSQPLLAPIRSEKVQNNISINIIDDDKESKQVAQISTTDNRSNGSSDSNNSDDDDEIMYWETEELTAEALDTDITTSTPSPASARNELVDISPPTVQCDHQLLKFVKIAMENKQVDASPTLNDIKSALISSPLVKMSRLSSGIGIVLGMIWFVMLMQVDTTNSTNRNQLQWCIVILDSITCMYFLINRLVWWITNDQFDALHLASLAGILSFCFGAVAANEAFMRYQFDRVTHTLAQVSSINAVIQGLFHSYAFSPYRTTSFMCPTVQLGMIPFIIIYSISFIWTPYRLWTYKSDLPFTPLVQALITVAYLLRLLSATRLLNVWIESKWDFTHGQPQLLFSTRDADHIYNDTNLNGAAIKVLKPSEIAHHDTLPVLGPHKLWLNRCSGWIVVKKLLMCIPLVMGTITVPFLFTVTVNRGDLHPDSQTGFLISKVISILSMAIIIVVRLRSISDTSAAFVMQPPYVYGWMRVIWTNMSRRNWLLMISLVAVLPACWIPSVSGVNDDSYSHDGQLYLTERIITLITLFIIALFPRQCRYHSITQSLGGYLWLYNIGRTAISLSYRVPDPWIGLIAADVGLHWIAMLEFYKLIPSKRAIAFNGIQASWLHDSVKEL